MGPRIGREFAPSWHPSHLAICNHGFRRSSERLRPPSPVDSGMRAILPTTLLLLGLALTAPTFAQVVINEIMAENNLAISDQDGESSDWIEIRNASPFAINISGWYLTDDAQELTKWRFPNVTLFGGAYVVIFASGKNRSVAGQQLHTNFRLSAGGEYLAIVMADGVTVASEVAPQYPPQHPDISWGYAGASTTNRAYLTPTPGLPNGLGTSGIVNVVHTPAQPTDTSVITVTASSLVNPGISISSATLRYRVNYGAEVVVPMTANGNNWSATIPASASVAGDMVRWRVTGTDSAGGLPKNPTYLSATNSPEYRGTIIANPGVTSALPILHWYVQNSTAAMSSTGTRCSVWYLGTLYDNVDVRLRGGSSTSWPKISYKFDFNSGYHFRYSASEEPVEEFNLNSTWGDKSFIRNVLSYDLYRDAGAPGSFAFPIRVQRNNVFHSVATFIEQPDVRLLRRNNLDDYGALYKMYNECTSASSGVEKQTRLYEGTADLAALVSGIQLTGTALETFLFDNLDIPKVLSYLAATSIMHDNDHVAKNYYLFRETNTDQEWMFLPWDKDLTWGRNYTLQGGVLNDTIWANVDPYSHPLHGDQAHPKVDGFWNRLIDAVYRVPRLQAMYARRLRTLMDMRLQAPGTPPAALFLVSRIAQLQTQMLADCNLDQAAWGVPNYESQALTFTAASNEISTAFLATRRTHLYNTHSTSSGGIVPPAQSIPTGLRIGASDPSLSDPSRAWIEIRNCSADVVDISGYSLGGAINFTFPGSTVVSANDSVFVAANVLGFRTRTTSPRGGERRFVVGPYSGSQGAGGVIILLTPQLQVLDSLGDFPFSLTTSGAGDVNLQVSGAAPNSEMWTLISLQTTGPLGCGPVLGLSADAFYYLLLPIGTHPFHVQTSSTGTYSLAAGPGSLPLGLTLDARVIAFATGGALQVSALKRVTF